MLTSSLRAFGAAGAAAAFGLSDFLSASGALAICPRDRLAAFQGQVFLAQRLELGMLRVQGAQIGVGALCLRRRLDDLLWIEQRQLAIEELAQGRGIGAAAAGVARVLEDGEAQRDLGVGPRGARKLGPAVRCHGRQPERRGVEAPVVGAADFGGHASPAGVRPVAPTHTGSCWRPA